MKGNATQLLRALLPVDGSLGAVPLAQLREVTGLSSHQLRDAADTLIGRGLVSRSTRGMLRITPRGLRSAAAGATITSGPNGPKLADDRSTFRTRIWRAMRMYKIAEIADLVCLAVNGQEQAPAVEARKYLEALVRANICGFYQEPNQRYILLHDLGPKAPHWNKRNGQVSDPNHGEVFSA